MARIVVAAGQLDRRVTIQLRTIGRDATGAAITTWSPVADVWARKLDMLGRDLRAAGAQDFAATTVFTIRWRADVKMAENRVSYLGNTYEIVSVAEIGRREGLELSTKRAV